MNEDFALSSSGCVESLSFPHVFFFFFVFCLERVNSMSFLWEHGVVLGDGDSRAFVPVRGVPLARDWTEGEESRARPANAVIYIYI